MTDREWLESQSTPLYMGDGFGQSSGIVIASMVSMDVAIEYGKRCVKSAGLSARGVCRLIDLDTSYDYVECSACGNDQGWHGVHYCPNCGAEVCDE